MFTFNNNNIFTGYIKQQLHSFNLPKFKVLRRGMEVFPGVFYTNGQFILKALTSGKFDIDINLDDFEVICDYVVGNKYLNLTKNLELNSHLYDTYTHTYLGDYLRFIRDYHNLDLLSMYNCFTGEIVKNLTIWGDKYSFISSDSRLSTNKTEQYVIYAVPVKFFEKYTIAIDCDTSVELICCIYDKGKTYLQGDAYTEFYDKTYAKVAGTKFNKPFVYKGLVDVLSTDFRLREQLYNQEKNLKLLIKLPIENKSSIVVLEGDYTSYTEYTFNNSGFSWELLGGVLDRNVNWFIKDESGNYIKVFDHNTNYYDAYGRPAIEFRVGETYYTDNMLPINTAEQSPTIDSDFVYWTYLQSEHVIIDSQYRTYYVGGPESSLFIDPDKIYYSFTDAFKTLNFEVKNAERPIVYYKTRELFPIVPKSSIINSFFVAEDTGVIYLWDIENSQYAPLSDSENFSGVYSRCYNSKLQLLFINDGNHYPFADKLVGYLLGHTITNTDNIFDNIRRLQKTFYYRKNPKSKPDYNPEIDGVKYIGFESFPKDAGVWTQNLRDMSYDLMHHQKHLLSSTFDTIGFIDKDVEKVLGDDLSYDKVGHSISGGVR